MGLSDEAQMRRKTLNISCSSCRSGLRQVEREGSASLAHEDGGGVIFSPSAGSIVPR